MSRIGKIPIEIPSGMEVQLEGNTIRVKGPKGTLERKLHPEMQVNIEDGRVVVNRPSDEKKHRSLHGLTRTLIANMVQGVTQGFEKRLEIHGVGYRAAKQGNKLVLSMGFSHPVEFDTPPGMEIEVPAPTRITVRGIDKEKVGQLAAEIRAVRKPEPYLGKGIRYEGEYVRRKAGKAGK
ncbi:MAG: 50S ribosomal protein L6 [Firmicutes bacterium]|nr:50S ribosomal protein L6 [Bacillota bacterium]